MTLTAATWGTVEILKSVEILLPNEAIIARIQENLNHTPEHVASLKDTSTMELTSQVLTDFIASCTASFTDATYPPTWEAISALWRSEVHIARRHLRETRGVAYAFEASRGFLVRGAKIDLHVDNTSALSAASEPFARSYAINAELNGRLSELPFHRSVTYIQPAENPVDIPSSTFPYQMKWALCGMGAGNRWGRGDPSTS